MALMHCEEIPVETIDQVIEPYDDELVIPKRIGFCTNQTDIRHICGRFIFDDDIEAVELPQIGRRRQFCCGPCVDRLIAPKAVIDLDLPEKIAKKHLRYVGVNGNGGKPKSKFSFRRFE